MVGMSSGGGVPAWWPTCFWARTLLSARVQAGSAPGMRRPGRSADSPSPTAISTSCPARCQATARGTSGYTCPKAGRAAKTTFTPPQCHCRTGRDTKTTASRRGRR